MARDVRIWFGGNSLTAGVGCPTPGRSRTGRIMAKLKSHLGGSYNLQPVMPPGSGSVFGGSIGQTLYGWLRYAKECQPHIVILNGGENDQGSSQCATLGNSISATGTTIKLGANHTPNVYEVYDADAPGVHEWFLAPQVAAGAVYRHCIRGLAGTTSRAWPANKPIHADVATKAYTGDADNPVGEPCWLRRMRVLIREVVGIDPDRPHPITLVSGLWFQKAGSVETSLLQAMVQEEFIKRGFRVAFCPWLDPRDGYHSAIWSDPLCKGPIGVTKSEIPNTADDTTITLEPGYYASAFDGEGAAGEPAVGDAVLLTKSPGIPTYGQVEGCIVKARPAVNQLTLTRSKFGTSARVVNTDGSPVYIGFLSNACIAPTLDPNVLSSATYSSISAVWDGHPSPLGAELMAQAEVEALLPLIG